MDSRSKQLFGYWESGISIFCNIVLFVMKYLVGIQTNSVALIADAWHTLSDSFSSFILLLGFKISNKPADKEHPFGHGRAEFIAAIIIGTILAIIGLNFLIDSIEKFVSGKSASFNKLAIIITIISIIIKELLAQFAFWAGKKTGSTLLRADGWHHRSDALSSILVLAGIFLSRYFWWIDSVLGCLISFVLFYASYDIIKSSINPLLGQSASENTINLLTRFSREITGKDIKPHHIHCHKYGNHQEITLHIKLPGEISLRESHTIADKLEKMIRDKFDMEATIHVEPSESINE